MKNEKNSTCYKPIFAKFLILFCFNKIFPLFLSPYKILNFSNSLFAQSFTFYCVTYA